MKAALCKSLNGPDGVRIEEIDEPVPGAGEVVVRVRAAALNFFDTLITRGKYQTRPSLPFSPCGEVAGVVERLGPDVTGAEAGGPDVGDRVACYVGYGGAREKIAVAARSLVAIPDGVSDEVASGIAITYGTAIHGLKDRGEVKPGETVAVLGASGGAGLAAVEVAKLVGARVIAVASTPEKLAICREHGADELLDYAQVDLKDELKRLTGGKGVDVVYDCVGGPHAEPAVRALGWQGRYLVVGFASGDIPKLPLNLLLVKGASAVGVFWGQSVDRDPAGHRRNMIQLLDGAATGRLRTRIQRTYPLDEISEAMRVLDRREAVGKIVIRI
ncbi:MAG: NADPH:quinone oxidoreductase family protein [Hyphomicrobium sp.]